MKKEKEEDGAGVKDGEAERIGRGEIRKEKKEEKTTAGKRERRGGGEEGNETRIG